VISVCLCTHLSLYLPYGWKQAALRHNRINLFLLSLCTIFVIIGKEAIDETICNHSSRGKRNSYGKRHSQTIHRNSRQTDISPYDRKFLPIRSEYRFNNRTSSKPTRILETAMRSSPNHNSPSCCQGGRNTFSFGS